MQSSEVPSRVRCRAPLTVSPFIHGLLHIRNIQFAHRDFELGCWESKCRESGCRESGCRESRCLESGVADRDVVYRTPSPQPRPSAHPSVHLVHSLWGSVTRVAETVHSIIQFSRARQWARPGRHTAHRHAAHAQVTHHRDSTHPHPPTHIHSRYHPRQHLSRSCEPAERDQHCLRANV
jgi:hypothetical protein